MHSNARRFVAALLTFLCAIPVSVGVVVATAAPASATSYRYWTYWWGRPSHTTWQYAGLGPASDMPGDGWVLGWRFEITSPTGGGAQTPRTSPTYADLCSDPAPATDQVRVAVVVDYGDVTAAPPGEHVPVGPRTVCVVVPSGSHGTDAMRAASVSLRYNGSGFVCGIDGYPLVGCSTPVAVTPNPASSTTVSPTPTSTPKPTPSPSHTSTPSTSMSATPTRTTPATSAPALNSAKPTASSTPAVSALASTGGTPQPNTTPTQSRAAASPSNASQPPMPTTASPTAPAAIASQPAPVTQSRNAFGLIIGLLGIAVLGGSAWFTSRRRGGIR